MASSSAKSRLGELAKAAPIPLPYEGPLSKPSSTTVAFTKFGWQSKNGNKYCLTFNPVSILQVTKTVSYLERILLVELNIASRFLPGNTLLTTIMLRSGVAERFLLSATVFKMLRPFFTVYVLMRPRQKRSMVEGLKALWLNSQVYLRRKRIFGYFANIECL